MSGAASFKIATYNCKYDDYPPHPWTRWDQAPIGSHLTRRVAIGNNIKQAQPQIICVQEIAEEHFNQLKQDLAFAGATPADAPIPMNGFYGQHWERRGGQVTRKLDGVGILYDPRRFEVLGVKTPTCVQRDHERAHVWCDLLDRTTQKVIRVAGVHLYGGPDRTLGDAHIQQIRADLESARTRRQEQQEARRAGSSYQVDAIAIAGDFNGTHLPSTMNGGRPDPRVTSCFDAGYQFDGSNAVSEISLNPQHQADRRLDYVLVKPMASLVESITPAPTGPQVQASDHHLVACELTIGRSAQAAQAPTMDAPRTQAPVQPSAVPRTEEPAQPCAVEPATTQVDEENQTVMQKLSALAQKVYDFVWDLKVPLALGTLGTIFAGWMVGTGVALAALATSYAIEYCWPGNPEPEAVV